MYGLSHGTVTLISVAVYGLFRSCVISASHQFGPGSFQPNI